MDPRETKERKIPATRGWPWLEDRLAVIGLLAVMAAAVYVCYLVTRPFFSVLAWTTALAIAALPLHERVEQRIRQPSIAAGVSVVLIALLLLWPAALIAPHLVNQAVDGVNAIQHQIVSGDWKSALERHAWIRPLWSWLEQRVNINDAIQRATSLFTTGISYVVKGSFVNLLKFLLVLFFLFFFFRDRDAAIRGLRRFLPLTSDESDKILSAVTDTIYVTIYGKLLVGIAQGFLGGVMFWWLGLTAPWFWAIVMAVLSVIPIVGPVVVWLPAAVFLMLNGHWIKALILTAWGALVVASIDNFLYPILIRQRLRMHTVPVFIAMVGGLLVFGASGFFVGPAALAVALTTLAIWRVRERPSALERGT